LKKNFEEAGKNKTENGWPLLMAMHCLIGGYFFIQKNYRICDAVARNI
jgi:hypothetical protein